MEKTIASVSPSIHRLLSRMTKYDINVKYIKGKTNVVFNALSHMIENLPAEMFIPEIAFDMITGQLLASHKTGGNLVTYSQRCYPI